MLLFVDSFDHYAIGEADNKWGTVSANSSIVSGRFSNGLQLGGSNATATITRSLDANEQTLVCGAAIKLGSLTPADAVNILEFADGGSTQVAVRQVADGTGRLQVFIGGTGSTTSANNAVSAGVYHYIEMKATIANSGGSVEVRVDGAAVITISGADTQATGNAYANQFELNGYRTQSGAVVFDDVYLCNDDGGTNDDFLGDCRVQYIAPNGNGTTSQLLGSDGNSTDNYLLVDESTPNSDTDYVASSTVDDKDTYNYESVTPTSGNVFGVQIVDWIRKTDAGARSFKTVARHSGTEEDSSSVPVATSYTYYLDIRETKPGGGSWSISDVNAAEFGVKVA